MLRASCSVSPYFLEHFGRWPAETSWFRCGWVSVHQPNSKEWRSMLEVLFCVLWHPKVFWWKNVTAWRRWPRRTGPSEPHRFSSLFDVPIGSTERWSFGSTESTEGFRLDEASMSIVTKKRGGPSLHHLPALSFPNLEKDAVAQSNHTWRRRNSYFGKTHTHTPCKLENACDRQLWASFLTGFFDILWIWEDSLSPTWCSILIHVFSSSTAWWTG